MQLWCNFKLNTVYASFNLTLCFSVSIWAFRQQWK